MKNTTKFTLVVLFVFISMTTVGQSVFVKGGLSFAKIAVRDFSESVINKGTKSKLGFHFGVSYEKKMSDVFVLEIGPMLHWKGANANNFYSNIGNLNIVYLDVPILVKGYFELKNDVAIYNAVGPYFGIGLWGKNTNWGGWTVDLGSDYSDDFTRVDVGLSLGIGVDYKGKQIGFAYDFSLLSNDPDHHPDYDERRKHRVVRLTLGYKFTK